MSDPFGKPNPFKTKSQSAFSEAHANADTDGDRSAIHHTLGVSPTQAAAGNHKHSKLDLKVYINDNNYRSDFPNIGGWNFNWTETIIDGDLISYKGMITLTAGFGGTAFISLPIPAYVGNVGYQNIIGEGMWIRSGIAYVPCRIYLDLSTPVYSRAATYSINPIQVPVTGAAPYAWQAGDALSFNIKYYRTPT